MVRRPTALGSYIFAGGQTVGVERAGFDIAAHLEDGKYGVATFKKNRPRVPVWTDFEQWPVDELRGKVDFVYCNPPCAVFSNAGKSHGALHGWRSDPRLACYRRAFGLLERLQPRVLTIESVTNAYRNGRELMQELEVTAAAQGYSTTHLFIDAQWLGVPQQRRRHFLTFSRARFAASAPDFTRSVSVGEVLSRVADPGWHRPPPQRLLHIYERLKPRQGVAEAWIEENPPETWVLDSLGRVTGRPRMMEARIPWDTPMGAYIGDFCIHPKLPRPLGINESRALCRYPDEWEIAGPPASGFSEFARSVLPPVAEWLGRQVLATLDAPALNRPVHDLVDFTTPYSLFGEGESDEWTADDAEEPEGVGGTAASRGGAALRDAGDQGSSGRDAA